jgi:hypothetical protein
VAVFDSEERDDEEEEKEKARATSPGSAAADAPRANAQASNKAGRRGAAGSNTAGRATPSRAAKQRMHTRKLARTVMDVEPVASSDAKGGAHSNSQRLEWIKLDHNEEFPRMTKADKTRRNLEASKRILTIAYERVFEPRIVKIVLGSCAAVVTLGFAEASLLCNGLPFLPVSESSSSSSAAAAAAAAAASATSSSIDTGLFCLRYALEQVVHSCIWSTQDASLVATAMGLDPDVLLRTFDPKSAADAATQLRVQMLASSRSIVAGFMLLAQLVRAVNISANAAKVYEARIRQGLEPPLLEGVDQRVVRLCGAGSDATGTYRQCPRDAWGCFCCVVVGVVVGIK